jgi:hypothetical protein
MRIYWLMLSLVFVSFAHAPDAKAQGACNLVRDPEGLFFYSPMFYVPGQPLNLGVACFFTFPPSLEECAIQPTGARLNSPLVISTPVIDVVAPSDPRAPTFRSLCYVAGDAGVEGICSPNITAKVPCPVSGSVSVRAQAASGEAESTSTLIVMTLVP